MTNRGVLLEKFFSNYPTADVFGNDDELKERFTAMTQVIAELRVQAIDARSIAQLTEVHALETDVSRLVMSIQNERGRKSALRI